MHQSILLYLLLKNNAKFVCFFPYRFYSRDSGLLKFKIHAGFLGRPIPPTGKRLVAFTFHPLYPFAISVQKTNAEYVVNFHIRHLTSGVEHSWLKKQHWKMKSNIFECFPFDSFKSIKDKLWLLVVVHIEN